jgi:DNA-directed RNA polymerase subunit F
VLRFNRKYREENKGQTNRLEEEIREYLDMTPAKKQRGEGIRKSMEKMKALGINKTEALQIVNLMPTTPVELYLIISNIEERLAEGQVGELLECIKEMAV